VTVVAVLGLGEAGGRLAADLVAAGAEVRGYDPFAAALGANGVVRTASARDAAAGADVVLSLSTAGAAREAAVDAAAALGRDAVYADLNTAAPALKRELAALTPLFADVALLGPLPARGLRTPALASGLGAAAFADTLGPLGMPVEIVSTKPGDAAALKLVRSIFMKGVAAAAVESLDAAEAIGNRKWAERQLAEVIGPELLERFVDGSRMHAARRVDEMEAACELLRSLGIEPHVAAASRALLVKLAEERRD
jgi:3-hydroxyisobutyrate dehydrogenase-like beta-hydroxyacid dehydrogenase